MTETVENPEGGLTSAEMYDDDIKRIAPIWQRIQNEFATKPNDRFHVDEMVKRATDEFHKIGYIVRIHTTECLLGTGAAELEVLDRVPGHEFHEHGFDHERKGWEVNRAVERNEDQQIREMIRAIEPGKTAKDDGMTFIG